MEITKEMEEKGPSEIRNPTRYLKAAVSRHLQQPGGSQVLEVDAGVHKRCTWLNNNLFGPGAIDDESMAALTSGMAYGRAMAFLKEMEEKGPEQIKNASGYIKVAVKREGGASGGGAESRASSQNGKNGVSRASSQSGKGGVDSGVHKRCTWLSANVFGLSAIDDGAVAALSSIQFGRAMEICKELEEKGPDSVANPSAYLKAAARREGSSERTASRGPKLQKRDGGKGPARRMGGGKGPAPTTFSVLPKLKSEA